MPISPTTSESTPFAERNALQTVVLFRPTVLYNHGIEIDAPTPQHRGTLALRHATGLFLLKSSNRIAKSFVRPIVNTISRVLSRPQSIKSDIEDFFGEDDNRERALDQLHANSSSLLQRHCHKLVEFAKPESSTVATQRVAFRILITVITRYPGLRRLFYRHKNSKESSANDSQFSSRWKRPYQSCDDVWTFYMEFALFCISESDLTQLVEAEPPSKLSRIIEGGDTWVPIETLLRHSSSSTFPRASVLARTVKNILVLSPAAPPMEHDEETDLTASPPDPRSEDLDGPFRTTTQTSGSNHPA
ncbi:hypothetical protein DFH06DRAFT_1473256 [Mycena polygramma]|nr:hypothetical protein DFH06DRAFT_1473256 [Mycena polygramma]